VSGPTTHLEMVWEDPPVGRRGRPGWHVELADELAELRKHPKRWAQLRVFDAGERKTRAGAAASHLRKTIAGFDFVGRTLPDGTQALYGRYVGQS
jgi:hypothetical protein